MAENDRESLKKFLAEEAGKDRILKQSQEEVRQELENRARQAIEKYQQECRESTPLAKERIQTVVQPWFDSLIQDGTYRQLLEWLKTADKRDVAVSDSILYYWPDDAFQGFEYSKRIKEEPFQGTANYVIRSANENKEDIKRRTSGEDEVWSAGFHIGGGSSFNNILNYYHGLKISQWPMVGGGYGFAVGRARSLEIPVDPGSISQAIPSIHPDVWIGFADQIENGTALQVLQESLIPKPIRVVDVGSAEHTELDRISHARREEYLKARMARGK